MKIQHAAMQGRDIFGGALTRVLVVCLSFAFLQSQSIATPVSYQKEIDALFQRVETIESQLDRGRFEIAAKVADLDASPERIFRFVRDEIRYEPYIGVLRGPTGTLIGGAGNSLDQSVLLSAMLDQAGYRTRFATARLDDSPARELLAQFYGTPPPADDLGWLDDVGRYLFQDGSASTANYDSLRQQLDDLAEDSWERIWDEADRSHELIRQALGRAEISIEPEDDDATLLDVARQHYWVLLRTEDGKWIDLDPVIAGSQYGGSTQRRDRLLTRLPDRLHHKLRVTVGLRVATARGSGSRIKDVELFDETFTAAALFANGLRVHNIPNVLPAFSDGQSVSDWLKSTTGFTFVVSSGQIFLAAKTFDLTGRVMAFAPPDHEQPPDTGAGERGLGTGLSLLDRLGSSTSEDPVAAPTTAGRDREGRILAQWIEYQIIPPNPTRSRDIEVRTYRRFMYRSSLFETWTNDPPAAADLRGVEEDDEAVLQLTQSLEVMPTTGSLNETYLTALELRRLRQLKPLFSVLPEVMTDGAVPEGTLADVAPSPEPLALLAFLHNSDKALRNLTENLYPGTRIIRSEPGLVAFEQGYGTTSEGELLASDGYDIVSNSSTIASRNRDNAHRVTVNLWKGVLETAVEHALLSAPQVAVTPSRTATGTAVVFDAAAQQGVPLVVLAPSETGAHALQELDVPAAISRQIAADLERGYIALAPQKEIAIDGAPQYAWWRVHPETGEALGQIPGPRGGIVADYALKVRYSLKAYRAALISLVQQNTIALRGFILFVALANCIGIDGSASDVDAAFCVGIAGATLGGASDASGVGCGLIVITLERLRAIVSATEP